MADSELDSELDRALDRALAARARVLNARPVHEAGRYVLCWLQQAIRARDNPAVDAAVSLANRLELPVLVYHGVREDYPHSSWRLHHFLLGASRELERGCAERGIACANLVVRPGKREKGLVYRLAEEAALVVTDDQPLFVGRWQAERFAARAPRAVLAVEANRLVPHSLLREGIQTTKAFRAAAKAEREGDWAVPADVEPTVAPYAGPLAFESDRLGDKTDAQILALIRACRVDQSLAPGALIVPTRAALDAHLAQLRDVVLPVYKWRRNNPAAAGSASLLSPYLHFGMVGPREVDRVVEDADAPAACKWKYRDELLTWRERFHYLAVERNNPSDYANVPEWARQTLNAHREDAREVYTLDQLIHAETGDAVWNAAQRQFLLDGYMHNNLRMYWGKKIIAWTPSPEAAWNTACYLNDRLSYDGRDPATYGNIEWVFGRGRPGYREIPVYGRVAPKSDRAIRGREGMSDWIAAQNARPLERVAVPNGLPDYADPSVPLGPGFPLEAHKSGAAPDAAEGATESP